MSEQETQTTEEAKKTGEINEPEARAAGRKKRHAFKRAIWKTIHTQIFQCFLIALGLELAMEILGRHSLFDAMFFMVASPLVFLYNTSIIFFTLLFAFFLRKRWFGIILVSLIWLTAGVVNFVVLGYRVTPFAAIDILMARDVVSMWNVYFQPWQLVGLVALGIIVIVGLVLLFRKTPKHEGSIHIKRTMLICLLVWGFLFVFTKLNIRYNIISDDFANLDRAY